MKTKNHGVCELELLKIRINTLYSCLKALLVHILDLAYFYFSLGIILHVLGIQCSDRLNSMLQKVNDSDEGQLIAQKYIGKLLPLKMLFWFHVQYIPSFFSNEVKERTNINIIC